MAKKSPEEKETGKKNNATAMANSKATTTATASSSKKSTSSTSNSNFFSSLFSSLDSVPLYIFVPAIIVISISYPYLRQWVILQISGGDVRDGHAASSRSTRKSERKQNDGNTDPTNPNAEFLADIRKNFTRNYFTNPIFSPGGGGDSSVSDVTSATRSGSAEIAAVEYDAEDDITFSTASASVSSEATAAAEKFQRLPSALKVSADAGAVGFVKHGPQAGGYSIQVQANIPENSLLLSMPAESVIDAVSISKHPVGKAIKALRARSSKEKPTAAAAARSKSKSSARKKDVDPTAARAAEQKNAADLAIFVRKAWTHVTGSSVSSQSTSVTEQAEFDDAAWARLELQAFLLHLSYISNKHNQQQYSDHPTSAADTDEPQSTNELSAQEQQRQQHVKDLLKTNTFASDTAAWIGSGVAAESMGEVGWGPDVGRLLNPVLRGGWDRATEGVAEVTQAINLALTLSPELRALLSFTPSSSASSTSLESSEEAASAAAFRIDHDRVAWVMQLIHSRGYRRPAPRHTVVIPLLDLIDKRTNAHGRRRQAALKRRERLYRRVIQDERKKRGGANKKKMAVDKYEDDEEAAEESNIDAYVYNELYYDEDFRLGGEQQPKSKKGGDVSDTQIGAGEMPTTAPVAGQTYKNSDFYRHHSLTFPDNLSTPTATVVFNDDHPDKLVQLINLQNVSRGQYLLLGGVEESGTPLRDVRLFGFFDPNYATFDSYLQFPQDLFAGLSSEGDKQKKKKKEKKKVCTPEIASDSRLLVFNRSSANFMLPDEVWDCIQRVAEKAAKVKNSNTHNSRMTVENEARLWLAKHINSVLRNVHSEAQIVGLQKAFNKYNLKRSLLKEQYMNTLAILGGGEGGEEVADISATTLSERRRRLEQEDETEDKKMRRKEMQDLRHKYRELSRAMRSIKTLTLFELSMRQAFEEVLAKINH